MRYDQSYGVVPVQKMNGLWHVFLVCHRSGHWSLPKGHPEKDETPFACAKRELLEETGLSITKLVEDEPLVERYQFTSRRTLIEKRVDYFVAEAAGEIVLQLEEVVEGRWFVFSKAKDRATYAQMKSLLDTVEKKLPE